MASARMGKLLAKHIAKNTLQASSFICLALFELGEIYVKSFFPPNYSYTKPIHRLLNGYDFDPPRRRNWQENLGRLVKQGFVEEKQGRLGLSKLAKEIVAGALQKRDMLKKKWDGKYRLVVFDIPEIRKRGRAWLRDELYLLNYIPLQKSVYIGKYPLTKDIVQNIKKLGLHDHVNYLLVDKLYDERRLKLLER